MQPRIYFSDEHHIREGLIDADALIVLTTLQEAGYTAYLVGGGVRDLLMGGEPKDYDISTSAHPEEIKELFGRKCLLIGRRFRLAHIRFGEKIIEVSTFRAGSAEDAELITRDNIWGTPEEDVLRRDFTMNGLYYDPSDHRIIDYVGGFQDLNQGLLRTIGDPHLRFKQDPVRMLRCLKFLARFNLKVDPPTLEAIEVNCHEILKSAPARLLEEILRMLESGASAPFIRLLEKHGLFDLLYPLLGQALKTEVSERIFAFLERADALICERKPKSLPRPTLFASFLFPLLEAVVQIDFVEEGSRPPLHRIHRIARSLVEELCVHAFPRAPRRFAHDLIYVLETQYRFTPLTRRKIRKEALLAQPEYPAARFFLELRTRLDPSLEEVAAEWELKEPPAPGSRRRPRRTRHSRGRSSSARSAKR